MWKNKNDYLAADNGYNWRTWLRLSLPGPMSGWINKGQDCEAIGSQHHWYNIDGSKSGCYHLLSLPGTASWAIVAQSRSHGLKSVAEQNSVAATQE